MTRHDTRHRQSLRRKFAFLTSVMRASPVLMRFLVLHPFMNVALSPHSSPAETIHLCSADCHDHLTVVLSRCTPIHWHHRTFFLADLDISPPAQPSATTQDSTHPSPGYHRHRLHLFINVPYPSSRHLQRQRFELFDDGPILRRHNSYSRFHAPRSPALFPSPLPTDPSTRV
jgi:hypothetical protein